MKETFIFFFLFTSFYYFNMRYRSKPVLKVDTMFLWTDVLHWSHKNQQNTAKSPERNCILNRVKIAKEAHGSQNNFHLQPLHWRRRCCQLCMQGPWASLQCTQGCVYFWHWVPVWLKLWEILGIFSRTNYSASPQPQGNIAATDTSAAE